MSAVSSITGNIELTPVDNNRELYYAKAQRNETSKTKVSDEESYIDVEIVEEEKQTKNSKKSADKSQTIKSINPNDLNIENISEISAKLSECLVTKNIYKSKKESLESSLKNYEEKLRELKVTLTNKQKEKEQLTKQLSNTQDTSQRQALQNKIKNLNSDCNSVCYDMSYYSSTISQKRSSLSNVQSNLQIAEENYETLQEAYNEAQQYQQQKWFEYLQEQLNAIQQSTVQKNSENVPENTESQNIVEKIVSGAGKVVQGLFNSSAAQKIAQAALTSGGAMGTVGWCFRGVCNTLKATGLWNGQTPVSGASAYMAADQLAARNDFKEVTSEISREDLKKLPAGAIVVWGQHSGKNGQHGHISVALGDGREASDHIQNQITNLYDSKYRVFLPV